MDDDVATLTQEVFRQGDHCGSAEVEGCLNPEGQVLVTHLGQLHAHAGDLDEALHAWRGGEQIAEHAPESGHALVGPHHTGEDEERQTEEDEAEHGRYLLPHDEVGDGHAEEDGGQQEGEEENHERVEVAQLRQMEPQGNEPQVEDADGDIDDQIAERASQRDAVDAVATQMLGDDVHRTAVLGGVAGEDADAQEDGLVDHQHQQDGQEEAAVASGGVEQGGVLHHYGLHLYRGFLAGQSCLLVALQLDGVHLVDKHAVAAGEGGLVVVERTHVAEHDDPSGAQIGQPGGEVFGEVEDSPHLMVAHQRLRLGQVVAAVADIELGRGVELVDKAFADVAGVLVDNGGGHLLHILVVVDVAEKQRVDNGGDKEYEQHRRVAENAAHLNAEHFPDIQKVSYYFGHLCVHVRRLFRGWRVRPSGHRLEAGARLCPRVSAATAS